VAGHRSSLDDDAEPLETLSDDLRRKELLGALRGFSAISR